jgi:predicted AlkP superfamily phosphohydrolase/phosphomutase
MFLGNNMKLLVIGIDGAHLEPFRRGWTPNIEKLINAGDILPVHEDLITRGWARIITGQGAEVTGALYDRPDLNGTTGWSLKFNMNSVLNLGSKVLPIWQVLSEMNVKVGIMNVPTVFPAPVVNGFFVSGGGGGAPVVQEPTADFCFPENIVNQLREWDYIVDERPNSLLAEKGLTLPTEVFQRLSYKNSKRVEAFKN